MPVRILSTILALTVLSGCTLWNRSAQAPVTTPAAEPAAVTDGTVGQPAPEPEPEPVAVAGLFPDSSYALEYEFDDGTPRLMEQILVTPERLVGVQGGVPYVTWHLRSDGLYRRDPLGGTDGALLRYLPGELRDATVWQQSSAGAIVWFRLRAAPECGPVPAWATPPRQCWDLQVLNRDQSQWFRFAPGLGIVAARILNLDEPAASFHKTATGEGLLLTEKPAEAPQILEQAGAWESGRAAPVQESTPAAFAAAESEWLGRGALSVGGAAGLPAGYLAGPWGEWTQNGLIVVRGSDSADWAYRPLGRGRQRFHLVTGPTPFVVVESQAGGTPSGVELQALALDRLEPLQWLTWGEAGPDRIRALRVQVSPEGTVTVFGQADGAGDGGAASGTNGAGGPGGAGGRSYRLEAGGAGSPPYLQPVGER